jgi:hypothetical protein
MRPGVPFALRMFPMAQSITEPSDPANNKYEKMQRLIVTSLFSGTALSGHETGLREFF